MITSRMDGFKWADGVPIWISCIQNCGRIMRFLSFVLIFILWIILPTLDDSFVRAQQLQKKNVDATPSNNKPQGRTFLTIIKDACKRRGSYSGNYTPPRRRRRRRRMRRRPAYYYYGGNYGNSYNYPVYGNYPIYPNYGNYPIYPNYPNYYYYNNYPNYYNNYGNYPNYNYNYYNGNLVQGRNTTTTGGRLRNRRRNQGRIWGRNQRRNRRRNPNRRLSLSSEKFRRASKRAQRKNRGRKRIQRWVK